MPAIISDQFRILNAANFVAGVADTSQYYYSFIGLPNSQDIGAGYGKTDWNTILQLLWMDLRNIMMHGIPCLALNS